MHLGHLLWRSDDGAATTALRRTMTRGFGILFLALSVLCLPGWWLHDDPVSRLLSGLSGALLAVSALRCARGAMTELDLGISALAAALVNLTPDLTGSSAGFTGSTVFSIWAIATTANLRPRAAYLVLGVASAAYLAMAWAGPTSSVSNAFDTTVFTAGMSLAAVGFVRALSDSTREQDAVTEEVTALEIAGAARDLEQTSSDSARRVLHDEVLTALRAAAELPPQRRDDVTRASRQAALAVRQHLAGS